MAQPSFDVLVDAVMQAESGNRRYDSSGKLLTSPKGAKGEMQVLDKTKYDPGYGVEPARDNTPDERARVGRDYLRAMLDRYGDVDKALAAYNWGPGNTDKWISSGASFDKLPAETRGYITKIKGTISRVQPPAAQADVALPPMPAAGAPAGRAGVAPVLSKAPVGQEKLAALGPNYQAALALSFLADEDEKDGEGRSAARGPSAADMLGSSKQVSASSLIVPFRSPFEVLDQGKPVRMAEGGDPVQEIQRKQRISSQEFDKLDPGTRAVLIKENPNARWSLSPTPATTNPVPFTLSTMPGARTVYDADAGSDTPGYVIGESRVKDFSGRLHPTQDVVFLNPKHDKGGTNLKTRAHEAEHLLAKRGLGDANNILLKFDELTKDVPGARRKFVEAAVQAYPYLKEQYGMESGYFLPKMLKIQDKYGLGKNLLFEQFAELSAIEQVTGKDLTKDPELRKTLFKDPKVRQAYNAMTGLRQTRLDARDLAPYTPIPESPDSPSEGALSFIRRKLGFNKGGEVNAEPTPEELERASKPAFGVYPSSGKGRKKGDITKALDSGEAQMAFAKGLTMLPQNVVGAPVDLINLGLMPFGLDSKKPVMGSEWLKEKSRAAGVAFPEPTDPTLKGFYTAGDLASNLVNPAGATRKVAQGVQKAGEAAGQAAKDFQAYNQALGPAGASYAVRPKGGHVYTAGVLWDEKEPITDLYLTNFVLKPNDITDPKLQQWTYKKLGTYLRRDIGSDVDPFVQATDMGVKTHIYPKGMGTYPFPSPISQPFLFKIESEREYSGFPKEGLAKTELGRFMEQRSDAGVFPKDISDVDPDFLPPGIRKFIKTDPLMPVYQIGVDAITRMKLDDLVKDMNSMRQRGGVYERHGQSVKIPEEYLLTDNKLDNLSPVQASEKVAQFKNWAQEADDRLASKALQADQSLSKVRASGGVWHELPDLNDYPRLLDVAQDVGNRGGWCTNQTGFCLEYGSKKGNRLSILLAPNGTPLAQVTVHTELPRVKDFLAHHPQGAYIEDRIAAQYDPEDFVEAIMDTPEFKAWAATLPSQKSVTEIKGAGNESHVYRQPYYRAVQEYIQHLDRTTPGGITSVSDLPNLGLIDVTSQISTMGFNTYIEKKMAEKLAIQMNNGSRYVNIVSDDPTEFAKGNYDYSRVADLLQRVLDVIKSDK